MFNTRAMKELEEAANPPKIDVSKEQFRQKATFGGWKKDVIDLFLRETRINGRVTKVGYVPCNGELLRVTDW